MNLNTPEHKKTIYKWRIEITPDYIDAKLLELAEENTISATDIIKVEKTLREEWTELAIALLLDITNPKKKKKTSYTKKSEK